MKACRPPVLVLLVLCLASFALPAAAQDIPTAPQPAAGRSVALNLLHISFASLEAVDVYTTVRGIRAGAVEANPLMRATTSHPVGMTAFKGAVAVSAIVLTRRMAREHRVAAILLTAGLNSAYTAVAVHNLRVVRR